MVDAASDRLSENRIRYDRMARDYAPLMRVTFFGGSYTLVSGRVVRSV